MTTCDRASRPGLKQSLSNAAGYSPQGSPILVTAVRDGGHVAVSVADRGRGIAEELLPELFRKFARASGGRVLHPGLTGPAWGSPSARASWGPTEYAVLYELTVHAPAR